MKSNREFLEGIYRKAEVLEKEKIRRNASYKKYIRFSSVAAMIVILPLLFFKSQIWSPYTNIEIPTPRVATVNDPISNFLRADFIVVGETKEISESSYVKEKKYIYTDINISLDRVLLGDINIDEITLRVQGGKVKKEKIFSQMEGEFNKGKRSLLFLYKDEYEIYHLVDGGESQFVEIEKDVFMDKYENKYNLQDIKNNIDRREIIK